MKGSNKVKRILNYPGSKWSLSERIIDLMPEHKSYLEPYAGSLAVFLNKPKDILETINDIDGRLVNMWRVLRDRPEELIRAIKLTPYAREEYELSKVQVEDELEDARRFLVRCWFAMGGKTNSNVGFRRNISWNGPYNTYDWKMLPNGLGEAAERLLDAQIEHKDAIKIISEMNNKDTLIYADPPYLDETRVSKHYANEMSTEDHAQLLETLRRHKGPVMLSGYNSELYNSVLNDWCKVEFTSNVGITTTKRRVVTEVMWLNYEPTGQLSLFDV